MAIDNIQITLTNGQKYKLRSPEDLSEIDRERTALFVFDNLQVYNGQSDGKVDEDGDFCITLPESTTPSACRLAVWWDGHINERDMRRIDSRKSE